MSDFKDNEKEIVEVVETDGTSALAPKDNGKKPVNKKDMIKNVAIGFLSVMLLLTFFSNTIMNYSLPQVATQSISYGSISPQIRGSGTVSAEDPYNITVKETRKITGVAVKEGAHVEIGDVIYYLEDNESEELKSAKEKLDDAETAYEQALFSGDVPDDVISRVRSGSTATMDSYQLKLKEVNTAYDNAKALADAATKSKEYLEKLKTTDANAIEYNKLTYEYENAMAAYEIAKIEGSDMSKEDKENAERQWNLDTQDNKREQTELATYKSQIELSYDSKILEATANETEAKKQLEDAEKEKTKVTTAIKTEISLCQQRDKIKELKEKIAKLEEESVGASIKTPVAGIVSSLAKASGETINADEAAAVIQVDGKDMTTSFSVTNQQAQKLKIGDAAKPQNAWMFGDDFKATLISIKNDKTDPANRKLLTFKVESKDITPGQSISLAIGERAVDYDMVVPNSAIKTGTASKFVLVVKSKSSPLGNRYIATKVDVDVLASDDNYSAITAALDGDEYVITTSNKPVKSGEQVRLANN